MVLQIIQKDQGQGGMDGCSRHCGLCFCSGFAVGCVFWHCILDFYLRGCLLPKRRRQIRREWKNHQFHDRTAKLDHVSMAERKRRSNSSDMSSELSLLWKCVVHLHICVRTISVQRGRSSSLCQMEVEILDFGFDIGHRDGHQCSRRVFPNQKPVRGQQLQTVHGGNVERHSLDFGARRIHARYRSSIEAQGSVFCTARCRPGQGRGYTSRVGLRRPTGSGSISSRNAALDEEKGVRISNSTALHRHRAWRQLFSRACGT
mmetsp:Transcript_18649/g.42933  ORF Transcript_18649/g.42933 Transcript_18649/m.42933 type:complete len:260 (+) Transcript_18649:783-1562(+)